MGNISFDFEGETVIITGAAQGIGKKVSEEFFKAGANVILTDINGEKLESTASSFKNEYGADRVLAVQMDVSKMEDINEVVKKSVDKFNNIDILFNNAGITRHSPLKDVTYEEWREIMKVNLDGAFFMAQAVGKEMIKNKNGKIINSASMCGFIIAKGRQNGVYSISKAGIVMMTKALAAEWSEYNIEVNAVAPGYTKTPIIEEDLKDPKKIERMTEFVPKDRLAEASEVAEAVLYLASSSSGYVTGHSLVIDGGYTI